MIVLLTDPSGASWKSSSPSSSSLSIALQREGMESCEEGELWIGGERGLGGKMA
jgi:hypothetical protein